MATSQTIIDAATFHLRARPAGETYSTTDSSMNAEIFTVLQQMINQFAEEGTLDIPAPATVGATLDIPDGDVRALGYLLASEIAAGLRRSLDPQVQMKAEEAKDRLDANNTLDLSVDMRDLSFTHWRRWDINSG